MTKSIRNLIIFSIVTISCGWIGVWINTQAPSPDPQQSLGLLIWILAPFVTSLLLRGFGKDGWSDFGLRFNFKGNGIWYWISVFIFPVAITITISLSLLFGASTNERPLSEFLPVFFMVLVASLVKNIFEEFAWRGYLTPHFKALGLSNFNNHILTGLIWGLWHIPYWIFFLDDTINQYTSIGLNWFIIMALIGMFPLALVLGELRLKTDSVWPPFIAHNITNAISAQLILEGFFKFKINSELLFAPSNEGIIMMALFWGVGLWMLRKK